MTIEFSHAEWMRVEKSAWRRKISPEEYLRQLLTEEPLSLKMVAATWVQKHLYELGGLIPQVGPARDMLNKIADALS